MNTFSIDMMADRGAASVASNSYSEVWRERSIIANTDGRVQSVPKEIQSQFFSANCIFKRDQFLWTVTSVK